MPALRTVDWRLTPQRTGDFALAFGDQADRIEMPLRAGDGLVRVSPQRGTDWLAQLLYSADASLPDRSRFTNIEVAYPKRSLVWFGFEIHWLVAYLALTVVFALVFKPFAKVHF